MGDKSLKESLARFMNPEAFKERVPDRIKFTCKEAGRADHDRRKDHRQAALKRADCAIRFFMKPENRELLDRSIAARAATPPTEQSMGEGV